TCTSAFRALSHANRRLLSGRRNYQVQIGRRIDLPLHALWIDGYHHFERGPHHEPDNVAGACRAIWQTENGMGVDEGLSLVECNIADHRSDFHLPGKWHQFVQLPAWIEPPQRGIVNRADRRKMCARHLVFLRKISQARVGIITGAEDDGIFLLSAGITEELNLHSRSLPRRRDLFRRYVFGLALRYSL